MAIIETKVLKTMSTGEKIKIHRQNRGMSQIDLAKIMGKSPVWLSKIEKEQREIRVSDLEKICKVLQVEVDQLLNVGIKHNSYKTILQNVVSSLPHEVPVYKMNEIKKILRSNETVIPTLYAYWDPNVLSSNNILGLFIEDSFNSPELNPGDRVYVNRDWHKGLLLDERLNKEKLINNFKNDTFWLIELLPDSSKKFSMSICNKCGASQDNLSEPNFDDEYSCICSEGFIISKSFTENKKILFSNNNESYASDSVRVIGRLVQVVKEI